MLLMRSASVAGTSPVSARAALISARMSCGAEAAADIRLSYRWLLSLAASAGRYEYIRDPRVTVLSDVDNSAVDVQAVSRMGGCETGGAPQLTALAEIAWFGPKGWGCRASAGYAGRRYVEPMPLRRTDRIAGQGGITREFFDAFTRQERLPDAFTLDAALFALFDIGMERLGLRCLNSFFEYYLPELFSGKLTVYIAAFAGLAALAGWVLLLCGKRAGITVIFAVSVLPFFKSILIFLTSILALFSAADLGAQALAFAKDFVTFVTAGLPIVLMLFWKGRGY